MTSIQIIDESEDFLRRRAAELTRPREDECLCCYVARLLVEFPCDGSVRHALHYRDVVAPRATDLAKRLSRMGGYCDCEVLMNGYQLRDTDEDTASDDLPPCKGVHSGSVQPCVSWVEIRRG